MNLIKNLIIFVRNIILISLLMIVKLVNAACPVEDALKKPLQEACSTQTIYAWLIAESPKDEVIYKDFSFASDNQTLLLMYLGNNLVTDAGGKNRGFDEVSGEIPQITCEFINKCVTDLEQQKKIPAQFNSIADLKIARNTLLQCTSLALRKYLADKYPSEKPETLAIGFPNVSYCKQSVTFEKSSTPMLDY